jgi:predicted permease
MPERVMTARVSADFLTVLQTQPVLGRNFFKEEDQPQGRRVAILSYPYWRNNFDENNDVIGQVIRVDDHPYEIIGVLPRHFQFPGPAPVELLIPLALDESQSNRRSGVKEGIIGVNVIGRLKPGVQLAQAKSDMELIQQALAKEYFIRDVGSVKLRPLHQYLAGEASRASVFLMLAVLAFWLLSCLNVGSLMLARAISRRSEMAIRVSLGANLRRLYFDLLMECIILVMPGALLGLLFTFWGRTILVSYLPFEILRVTGINLDSRVIAFVLVFLFLTALVVSVIASAELPRMDISRLIRGGVATDSPRVRRAFIGVVVGELVFTVVLISLGTIMVRSYLALRYGELGFNAERVLTLRLVLIPSRYSEPNRKFALFESIVQRVQGIPGVENVGFCSLAPPAAIETQMLVSVEGRPSQRNAPLQMARPNLVNEEYFRALKIRAIEGSTFTGEENENSEFVVVVNYAFAKSYLGEEPFVGRRIGFVAGKTRTVIGVVENIKNTGLHQEVGPEVYLPYRQAPPGLLGGASFLIRSSKDLNIASAVRQEIWAIDPDQPISEVQTMNERLNMSVDKPRLTTILLTGFSSLALLVTLIGVYGVVSFTSRQQAREIAIRMVIGANPGSIAWMIIRNMLFVSILSIALGIALAVLATRFMSSLLYGVTAFNIYAVGAPLALSITAYILACSIPAYRAARTDPATVLRAE